MCFLFYNVPGMVKFIEIGSRSAIARGLGRGKREVVTNGYKFAKRDNSADDSAITRQMRLIPLAHT